MGWRCLRGRGAVTMRPSRRAHPIMPLHLCIVMRVGLSPRHPLLRPQLLTLGGMPLRHPLPRVNGRVYRRGRGMVIGPLTTEQTKMMVRMVTLQAMVTVVTAQAPAAAAYMIGVVLCLTAGQQALVGWHPALLLGLPPPQARLWGL